MKLFIDSNIWLRYILGDEQKALNVCTTLFKHTEEGKILPYTSAIVFLEVYWVLTSYYHINKRKVQKDIDRMLQTRGLVIVEKTDFRRAFILHRQVNVKLADCLIATQIGKGIALCTYDTEFKKFPSLSVVTPQQVIQ